MQLRMFPLFTILFLNTNQILTMNWFNNSLTSNLLMVFFGSSWNKPTTQATTNVTAKKMMIPLVEFPNATTEEKELIKKCNDLELGSLKFGHNYRDRNIYQYQALNLLEKQVATMKQFASRYEEQSAVSEDELAAFLKKSALILHTSIEMDYPNTNWGRCGLNATVAYKDIDQLIEFYIKIRPQLIQNKTEEEYFRKRLEAHNKKHEDFHVLKTECTRLENMMNINDTMNHENIGEAIEDFVKSKKFEEHYSKIYRMYGDHAEQTQAVQQFQDAQRQFFKLQKEDPNYETRKTFLETKIETINYLKTIISNRTGFEIDFGEFCCCAPDIPTEVLRIIHNCIICDTTYISSDIISVAV